MGKMRGTIHQVDAKLEKLLLTSKANVEAHNSFVHQLAYGVFFILLILSSGFAMYVSKTILTGITQLKESMVEVSQTNDLTIVVERKR